MGNERFGFGKGELERLLQKLSYPLLDFLGFAVWPTEPHEPIICIPEVVQTPVVWVSWVKRRELLHLLTQGLDFFPVSQFS